MFHLTLPLGAYSQRNTSAGRLLAALNAMLATVSQVIAATMNAALMYTHGDWPIRSLKPASQSCTNHQVSGKATLNI